MFFLYSDKWWAAHQLSCGGNFIKVKEPEGYQDKKNKKTKSLFLFNNFNTLDVVLFFS